MVREGVFYDQLVATLRPERGGALPFHRFSAGDMVLLSSPQCSEVHHNSHYSCCKVTGAVADRRQRAGQDAGRAEGARVLHATRVCPSAMARGSRSSQVPV